MLVSPMRWRRNSSATDWINRVNRVSVDAVTCNRTRARRVVACKVLIIFRCVEPVVPRRRPRRRRYRLRPPLTHCGSILKRTELSW